MNAFIKLIRIALVLCAFSPHAWTLQFHRLKSSVRSSTLARNYRISGFQNQLQRPSELSYRLPSDIFAAAKSKIPTIAGKTRVRLLADVKDLGRKGEIVLVSTSMFTNVLQKKKQAERVSDEEIARIEEQHLKEVQAAKDITDLLQADDFPLIKIYSKVGAKGKLFGSVSGKQVVEEIVRTLEGEFSAVISGDSLKGWSLHGLTMTADFEGNCIDSAEGESSSRSAGGKGVKHVKGGGGGGGGEHEEIRAAGSYTGALTVHSEVAPVQVKFSVEEQK